ncbi:MAG: hypothetical protein IJ681_10185 [Bacteroidales bacterium]|nr:hypothetical protein [Bacteroidales bacterium]
MYKFVGKTLLIIVLMSVLYSCDNAPQMPKPSTYLRLDLLKPKYITFDNNEYPFTFMSPDYAVYQKMDSKDKDIKFFNLNFDKYNFVANVTFLPLTSDTSLRTSVKDCYTFLKRHEKLSGGIVEREYADSKKRVYGTVFEIKGKDVVSPYQLYITDSVKYFVRIALNSNFIPNNDSCEVVINQLKKDIDNIITTFEWR